MAELVDAPGSGSGGCTPVRVQIPASAPKVGFNPVDIRGLERHSKPLIHFGVLFQGGLLISTGSESVSTGGLKTLSMEVNGLRSNYSMALIPGSN